MQFLRIVAGVCLACALAGPASAQSVQVARLLSKVGVEEARLLAIERLVSSSGHNPVVVAQSFDVPMQAEANRLAAMLAGSGEDAQALQTLIAQNESLQTFILASRVLPGTTLKATTPWCPLYGKQAPLVPIDDAIFELALRQSGGSLVYNSNAYYAQIFTAGPALDAAESVALQTAREDLLKLGQRTGSSSSETERLQQILRPYRRLNLTDFDGTRSRLEDLGTVRNQEVDRRAQELVELEATLGVGTVKVSGRPLVWPGIGLLDDPAKIPPLAIGEAGSAMAIDGIPSAGYQAFIDSKTGFDAPTLDAHVRAFLTKKQIEGDVVAAFRPQPQNHLTHKIAYDVQLAGGVPAEQIETLQAQLQQLVGSRAKVLQTHFLEAENAGVEGGYRIDIVPGDKADAADYVASKLAEGDATLPILTAGDSGNDLGLVGAALNPAPIPASVVIDEILNGKPISSNVFIAVGNRHASLKKEITRIATPASSLLGLTASERKALAGVYFVTDDSGGVRKVILDDAELARYRDDLPLDRHGPESLLNAYALIFP